MTYDNYRDDQPYVFSYDVRAFIEKLLEVQPDDNIVEEDEVQPTAEIIDFTVYRNARLGR